MLTREQNDQLTRTGPGTVGGDLLRRYWQPIALAEELPSHGAPLPVRVLGEDLVLYRDKQGRSALLGLHCSHRGADLSYGRLEAGGLRCLYHGWLYNAEGRCLDQPGEPEGSDFHTRVRHTAYPCQDVGGMIFAYLGPGEPPLLPGYDVLAAPAEHRFIRKYYQECNYLQANEGNIDPSHQSFLHRSLAVRNDDRLNPNRHVGSRVEGTDVANFALYGQDVRPVTEVEETDFGLRMFVVRTTEQHDRFVRIYNFVLPNSCVVPGQAGAEGYSINWHVPIDDTHHWKYMITYWRTIPENAPLLKHLHEEEAGPSFLLRRTRENRYLQDRADMKAGWYTGMGAFFPSHDAFATETQGGIQDRTQEHLGVADRPIILARQALVRALDAIQAGQDPPGVIRGTASDWLPQVATRTDLVRSTENWEEWKARVRGEGGSAPREPALATA